MIGPSIPTHLTAAEPTKSDSEQSPVEPEEANSVPFKTVPDDDDEDDEDDYAPALPPDMLPARTSASHTTGQSAKRQIGPSFPRPQEDEDEDEDVGPMPLPAHLIIEEKDGVQEFMEREERRRKQIEVSLFVSNEFD